MLKVNPLIGFGAKRPAAVVPAGISVVGVGTHDGGISGFPGVPSLPAGWAAGDIHVLLCESNGETISAPTGFTQAANSPQTGSGSETTRITVFWRRAVGGDSAPSVSCTNHVLVQIIGFRGCVASGDPWDATSGGNVTTFPNPISITGVTTTVANACVLAVATAGRQETTTAYFSSWTNSNLTSVTEQIDRGIAAGDGGILGAATGFKATAGATGATTVNRGSASFYAFWCGALIPA